MNAPLSLAQQARFDDAADAMDVENAAAAKRNAAQYVTQDDFWADLFADEPPTFLDVPLAVCMKHLKAACEGDTAARDAICGALHEIERQSIPLAEKALKTIYDGEESYGR